MSRLTELISKIKSKDSQLGVDLEREFKALSSRREFGLNFERHRPEIVELPNRAVRKGDKVRVLPKRGNNANGNLQSWLVKQINKSKRIATLESIEKRNLKNIEVKIEDLVVIAEFHDYIYPGLVSTGRVEQGNDKPFHTVINAENYHALKALTFTHKGKIDAICIDPPYNTGSKDWKYNNNYVEADDLYRHSKWLAFMERRLILAKQLLNPKASVLICSIDEKEYLRLGMLLEQTFPEARIQMISTVINPKGVPRDGLSRVDEYIFLVQFGLSRILGEMKKGSGGKVVRWRGLARTGANGVRSKSPGAFYPIYFNTKGELVKVGDALALNEKPDSVITPKGLIGVWPTPRPDGEDGRWSVVPETLKKLIDRGAVKTGRVNVIKRQFPIFYLTSNQLSDIDSGKLEVMERTSPGILEVYYPNEGGRISAPRTVWDKVSHSASEHGSMLLRSFLPNRKFPFPKSLYAVEDVLRIFVLNKPDAVILDFFAGSGTTAHAVMRLNCQDGGARQCISVTNNEVSADEQKSLREKGLRPGDDDWEKWGICDFITKPRIKAAITGETPDGKKIEGEYKFNDIFPMSEGFEENAEFFTLTYQTPIAISYNLAFEHVSPLLWMRAGSKGKRIEKIPKSGWEIADNYGILVDLDKSSQFCKALNSLKEVKLAYIVTNDDRRFQSIAKQLPNSIEPIRLYESYLKNFQFTSDL